MTPIAASLLFIIIGIVVSVFRQLIFHTSSINSGDDSNIGLTKLHTLTIPQQSDNKLSFNSLYQAYFRPSEKKEPATALPYNSYVLKKAILNNEDVYICDQKFAAIFDERTTCEGLDSICKWRTIITVYRLPYLKKQEEKTMEIEGRVLKSGGNSRELYCKQKQSLEWQSHFELNFVVLQRSKHSKKGSGWTMNSLIITQEHKQGRKNGTFVLKMMKWNLKNVLHYPKIYSFDEKCLSYVTEQQPWLIYFNCGGNWSSFNILNPKIQNTLFSAMNTSTYPPFSPNHHITPLFLHLFKSSLKTYFKPQTCTGACPKQQNKVEKNFITYVFEIVNSQHLVGSTVAQLTIAINHKPQSKQNQGLVSYSVISNEVNPERKINIDCSLQTSEINLIKGLYAYQIGLYSEDHIVATISRHTLLCICSYSFMQNLKIMFFQDLLGNLNITDIPSELLVRTNEDLQFSRVESIVKKEANKSQSEIEEEEESGWFDFDFFDERYNIEDSEDKQSSSLDESMGEPEYGPDDQMEQSQKKDKKGKLKVKRDDKKKSKKGRKQRKEDNSMAKSNEDRVSSKIAQIVEIFDWLGHQKATQAQRKILRFPMPFTLTSDSKFRIVSGDLEFPLIYIETAKKYLLTYQPSQQQDSKNETKRTLYSYKYSEIGTSIKAPENYLKIYSNETAKPKKKEEAELDRFLLDLVQQNSDLLNQVKSIIVVPATYEGSSKDYADLKGLKKPFRKEVIVVWGWGIEVYQINWDKHKTKNQISQIQEILNSGDEGIEMLTLLPFIELFATVFCLFQTLINPR